MALDPAADLAALLAQQDMAGITVQATVGTGPGAVDGISTVFYAEVQGVSTQREALAVATAAVTSNSIVIDTQLTISGTVYKVKDFQPAGWGMTLLVLEEQP